MNRLFLILLSMVILAKITFANDSNTQSKQAHIEVSMRMVGHQVLLSLGDSISRILPIEKNKNQYRIRFEREFAFHPESLGAIIDSVIAATNIATSYIVAFELCETNEIVNSYEIGISDNLNVEACSSRDLPNGCYNLLITILTPSSAATKPILTAGANDGDTGKYVVLAALIICVLLPFFLVQFLLGRKTNSKAKIDQNIIPIGAYQFNIRKMELSINGETIELTSKESDLLQLLCNSTNNTVERETILKMVWADDGDYVGRTLDVFISKLRKKLEGDSTIKIANIRGVGYKLIVDSQ